MLSYGKLYKFLHTVSQIEAWLLLQLCDKRSEAVPLLNFCSLLFGNRERHYFSLKYGKEV